MGSSDDAAQFEGATDGEQGQTGTRQTTDSNTRDHQAENGTGNESRPPKRESVLDMATSKALRPFVIISSSYLLFTVTDGAIRMIVLLHAYNKNFSALEVAIMFTLYELAGVVTNLVSQNGTKFSVAPFFIVVSSKH